MKQRILSVLLLMAACVAASGQPVSTVVTCPGEDASSSMRISWSAPSKGYFVKYCEDGTKNKKSATLEPETEFRCTTFSGVSSKAADGSDIVEDVVMMKCGATLSGLRPNTKYKYVICDPQGGEACSEHRFITAGATEWQCCVISDFHAYTPLQHRQDAAMKMIDTVTQYGGGVDWTLHLGDITAWGASWSFWEKLYSEPTFSNMMWAGCVGNHDYMARNYSRLSNEFFNQANYYPENGYSGQMGVCYHFRYGEVMFVMLNSESMRSDAGLEAAQRWVRKVVTEARNSANAPRYVVVCEHYQWFFGGDGTTSQYGRWNELFDELGIDLALAGNNHIYVRTDAVYGGKLSNAAVKGTVYVQTPSADDERGQTMKPELKYNQDIIKCRWTEGAKTVGAMLMKVNRRKIMLTLLDRNGTVIDRVDVPAKR
ncbi:MAG: metallophosphoesterase [Muribaculaceae bacterium]